MKGCLVWVGFMLSLLGLVGLSMYLGLKDPQLLTPFESWMYDTGMGLLAGVVIGLWGVGIGVSVYRRSRRVRAAYAALASELGLEYTGQTRLLEGEYRGRAVRLKSWTASSGGGGIGPTPSHSTSRTYQELVVELRGAPGGLNVSERDSGGDLLSRLIFGQQPPAAPPTDLESAASVWWKEGEPQDEAWLTPARREALLELMREPGYGLQDGALRWSRSGRSEDTAELPAALARLEQLAERLETAPDASG